MKPNKPSFKSWREADPTLTVKWSSNEEAQRGLQSIIDQFPDIKFELKKNNKVKFIELPATRVFWIKQMVERLDGKIV